MNQQGLRANQLTAAQADAAQDAQAWLFDWARTLGDAAGDLSSDARRIQSGDAFVAYAFDAQHDGRSYIEQAHGNGAAAVLWQNDGAQLPVCHVANYAVPELNILAGHIAHAYYGEPSNDLRMVAVTGTNGKTSCAQWLAQLLGALDEPCGLIGTLGVGFVGNMTETGFTTPQAIEVHRMLRGLAQDGAKAVTMEVSSHALAQGRVNGVAFDVALFTNLSRDHLDYHGDMAEYEAAKAALFTWHGLKTAVINMDDAAGVRMAHVAQANGIAVIGYGFNDAPHGLDSYLQAKSVRVDGAFTAFELNGGAQTFVIKSTLVGDFNVMNLLGVLGVGVGLGYPLSAMIDVCASIEPAPGRMQRVGSATQPLCVIDFAHTPDALAHTLNALAPIARERGGKLICVFGCGGDRDAGKRPLMGSVAANLCDAVWITSDNPRSEPALSIVEQIASGATGRATVRQVVLRQEAIAQAIHNATQQDVILIAGKGHEAYQEIMGVKHPYSDLNQVTHVLEQWKNT